MNYKIPFVVILVYGLLSAALAFALNHLLLQTDYVIGDAMPLFGIAVFLLPVIWAGPMSSVVATFIIGFVVCTLLTLVPFYIGWRYRLHGVGLGLLAWAALWMAAGFFGTYMLDNTSSI
ncbi:MAG: hypothetical protein R3337_09615 [Gammaproteobacteria bacterium]|nr:hypothetical protein [Gammaproteobacteria bacterium]